MAYTFKTNIASKNNYGGVRALNKIKYIVIHYTANDGDTDEGNGNYFKNHIVKASAHYFVDDDSVTQSVPDNYVAWSVGGSKYSNCNVTGGGRYYGTVNNTNSISIEICDDVKNGVVYPSAATIGNAVEFTKTLMKKYNIPMPRVIRHFDVTGKTCPAYWCGTSEKNQKWLTEFWNKLGNTQTSTAPSGGSTSSSFAAYKVKVICSALNIRKTPNWSASDVVGVIKDKGVYTIVAEKTLDGTKFGKLKSGQGWISLGSKYVKRT